MICGVKLDNLIPFILHFETGVSTTLLNLPNPTIFQHARKRGFANDPDDAGGATMCGVTIGTYKAYRKSLGFKTTSVEDLKNMSYGEWFNIIHGLFWNKWKADQITSQPIANMLVDWVWTSGAYGIKIPQKLLGVKADGIVGPITLAALNKQDPVVFFNKLKQARIDYIDSIIKNRPLNAKFRRGWLRRINAITFNGFDYSV